MLRELAKLKPQEAHQWYHCRQAEIKHSLATGTISKDVGESLLEWAHDSYVAYLAAYKLCLLGREE